MATNSNYTFDGNEINFAEPTAGLTLNGYAINAVPASNNINFLLNKATRPYGNNDLLGSFKVGVLPITDPGFLEHWILLETNKTIGMTIASGATLFGDVYQDLFEHLWNRLDNTDAPVLGGRGASANADWVADRTLGLPQVDGRVFAGANTTTNYTGRRVGTETHTLTEAEMPTHTHVQASSTIYSIPGIIPIGGAGVTSTAPGTTTEATGGGAAHNILQPTGYYDVAIKY